MQEVIIADRKIGKNHRPFIIAEMSGNHNQSLEKALKIVDAAADAGADAIKIQTYTPDTLTIDSKDGLFFIKDNDSLWAGKSLYDLYKEAYTPWEWHKDIFERAKKRGIIAFSSPFDETAVDYLEALNIPAYKIASFENSHLPLLKKVASTGKPVIMSTGISSIGDLDESIKTLRNSGCINLILLKCTSSYPASPENINLNTIPNLSQLFNSIVGLSDHTLGIGVAIAAVALGASVIEKHFTLDRAEGGVDSAFSLEPNELKALVEETTRAFEALGSVKYEADPFEKKSAQFKRSVYVVKDINKGEVFNSDNLKIIRPGGGLHPRYFEKLMGCKSRTSLKKGTPLTWDYIYQ